MRVFKMLLIAGVFLTVWAMPVEAKGAPVPCTVDPPVVSLSSTPSYTVTATGGVPGELYEIIISQRRDGVTDEGRDALVAADEQGVVAWTFQTFPWVDGLPSGLLVDDASVKVDRYRTGGGPGGGASTIGRCGFTVVE